MADHPLRRNRDMPAYVDDTMYDGAHVPEPRPKRCRGQHTPGKQVAIDNRVDLICTTCGAMIREGGGD